MTAQVVQTGRRPRQLADRFTSRPRRVRNPSPLMGTVFRIAMVSLVAVGCPAFVAWRTGSLGVPHNDDWAYRRAALTFFQTGHLHLLGWGAMTFVGQILFIWPFYEVLGAHPWVPAVAVASLAIVGIVAWYKVCRQLLPERLAVVALIVAVAVPGFAMNTVTYMTDVPVWTFDGLCLACGVLAASTRGSRRWAFLGASCVSGCFAFSIREFSIAAPLAVLAAFWWSDARQRRAYERVAATLLAICGAIYLWTNRLPGQSHNPLVVPRGSSVLGLVQLYFTLAFVLSPVVVWLSVRLWSSRSTWPRGRQRAAAIGLVTGVAASIVPIAVRQSIYFAAGVPPVWVVGNLLDQWGAGGQSVLAGVRPAVVPQVLWEMVNFTAIVSGVVLLAIVAAGVGRLLKALRSRNWTDRSDIVPLLPSFLLVSALMLVGYQLAYSVSFDRYLWPVATSAVALLIRFGSGVRTESVTAKGQSRVVGPAGSTVAFLCGAVLVSVSAMITVNSFAFDSARWRAGLDALHLGYSAATVDAGLEWTGYHSTNGANKVSPRKWNPSGPVWAGGYERDFPGDMTCAVVSASPLHGPDVRLLRVVPYRRYWLVVNDRLYLYGIDAPHCPSVLTS